MAKDNSEKTVNSSVPVVYVEPNSQTMYTDGNGENFEKAPNLEDFSIYVNFAVEVKSRYAGIRKEDSKIFVVSWNGNKNGTSKSDKSVDFMQGTKFKFTDTDGKEASYYAFSSKFAEYIPSDRDVSKNSTTEFFGIESVDISYGKEFVPQVTVEFVDVRGLSLFSPEQTAHDKTVDGISGSKDKDIAGSFFNAFFTFPYPRFTMVVKGFYGRPIAYELNATDWKAKFDFSTGNWGCSVTFIGYSFSLISDITLNMICAAPLTTRGNEYWTQRGGATAAALNKANSITGDMPPNDDTSDVSSASKKDAKTQNEEQKGQSSDNTINGTYYPTNGENDNGDKNPGQFVYVDDDTKPLLTFKDYLDNMKKAEKAVSNMMQNNSAVAQNNVMKGENDKLSPISDAINDVFSKFGEEIKANGKLTEAQIANYHIAVSETDIKDSFSTTKKAIASTNVIISNYNTGANKDKIISTISELSPSSSLSADLRKKFGNVDSKYKFFVGIDAINAIESINKITKSNSDSVTANEAVISEQSNNVRLSVLGFTPSVQNIIKMICAHIETFLYLMHSTIDEVQSQRTSRTLTSMKLKDTDTDVRYEDDVPPFPKVAVVSTGNQNKMEDGWLADVAGETPETRLVEELLTASKTLATYYPDTVGENADGSVGDIDNGTAIADSTLYVPYPVSPTDFLIEKNDNVFGTIELQDIDGVWNQIIRRYVLLRGTDAFVLKNKAFESAQDLQNEGVDGISINPQQMREAVEKPKKDITNTNLSTYANSNIWEWGVNDAKNFYEKYNSYAKTTQFFKNVLSPVVTRQMYNFFGWIQNKNDIVNSYKGPLIAYKNDVKNSGSDFGTSSVGAGWFTVSIGYMGDNSYYQKYCTRIKTALSKNNGLNKYFSYQDLSPYNSKYSSTSLDAKSLTPIGALIQYKSADTLLLLYYLSYEYHKNNNDEIKDTFWKIYDVVFSNFESPSIINVQLIDFIFFYYYTMVYYDTKGVLLNQGIHKEGIKYFGDENKTDGKSILCKINYKIFSEAVKSVIPYATKFDKILSDTSSLKDVVDKLTNTVIKKGKTSDLISLIKDISQRQVLIMRLQTSIGKTNEERFRLYYSKSMKDNAEISAFNRYMQSFFVALAKTVQQNEGSSNQSSDTQQTDTATTDSGTVTQNDNAPETVATTDISNLPEPKIAMYNYLKLIYDRWLAGMAGESMEMGDWSDFYLENFYGRRFKFIDTYYYKIGSQVILNPEQLWQRIVDSLKKNTYQLSNFISDLLQDNNMSFMCIQNFMDLSNSDVVKDAFTPMTFDSLKFTKPETDFICLYTYEPSHVAGTIDDYKKDESSVGDSFVIKADSKGGIDTSTLPPVLQGKDSNNGYAIPCFGVTYGKQYQSYFKSIQVDMNSPAVTEQVISTQFSLGNLANSQNGEHYIGQDLFTIYSNYSYYCTVSMMGCGWIQPSMYFVLNNIPMFNGTYIITKVTHHIANGDFTTTFGGNRISRIANPLVKTWCVGGGSSDSMSDIEEQQHQKASADNDCPYYFYEPSGMLVGSAQFNECAQGMLPYADKLANMTQKESEGAAHKPCAALELVVLVNWKLGHVKGKTWDATINGVNANDSGEFTQKPATQATKDFIRNMIKSNSIITEALKSKYLNGKKESLQYIDGWNGATCPGKTNQDYNVKLKGARYFIAEDMGGGYVQLFGSGQNGAEKKYWAMEDSNSSSNEEKGLSKSAKGLWRAIKATCDETPSTKDAQVTCTPKTASRFIVNCKKNGSIVFDAIVMTYSKYFYGAHWVCNNSDPKSEPKQIIIDAKETQVGWSIGFHNGTSAFANSKLESINANLKKTLEKMTKSGLYAKNAASMGAYCNMIDKSEFSKLGQDYENCVSTVSISGGKYGVGRPSKGNYVGSFATPQFSFPLDKIKGINIIAGGYYGDLRDKGRIHQGLDLGTVGQEPLVHSVLAGEVAWTGTVGSAGNAICICHDNVSDGQGHYLHTFYLHVNPIKSSGHVNQDEPIAKVYKVPGYQKHLHFQVHFITKEEGRMGSGMQSINNKDPKPYLEAYKNYIAFHKDN